jgi:hypothetical protein
MDEKKQFPPWFEQKLWHLYDATDYAGNFFNCPVVAYSGEIDPQKQAADLMQKVMAEEGLTMTYIIGPNTAHKYEPKAKLEVAAKVDAIAAKGRNPWPNEIKFTTWTLRCNQMDWVTIDGLERHWERARVDARIALPNESVVIRVTTTNVSAFTLDVPIQVQKAQTTDVMFIDVDGQNIGFHYKRGQICHFGKSEKAWSVAAVPPEQRIISPEPSFHLGSPVMFAFEFADKRHGLQGPIDDAFMDSFIFVRPTGKPQNAAVAKWINDEMTNAITQWRLQFRGEPRVKDDSAITDDDIASNNLVLWGDPESNRFLAKIASRLLLRWGATEIRWSPAPESVFNKKYSAQKFVPVMIYPNPLNPKRYVVLNSGFTFGEAAHTSNALQTPKLPDYAILDISVPRSGRPASGVVDAGFFDEHWQLPVSEGK